MILAILFLAGSISVIPAPGWSYPMITVDMWDYDMWDKTLNVTGSDTLHQAWEDFNQESRIGYKAYLPDGTVIHPETMISNDVYASYCTSSMIGEDSVAVFWGEGYPSRYYCVRDSTGGEAVPTGLFDSTPYPSWPRVRASSDSLGRLHAVFETNAGACYMVYQPGVGEIRRDTLPSDPPRRHQILVDGDRVHIVYLGLDGRPDYIQYDLDGNVTVPATDIIDEYMGFDKDCSIAVDSQGDLHCLYYVPTGSGHHVALFKIDGATGDVLIYDKEIWGPSSSSANQTILPAPSGELLYVLWLASDGGAKRYVIFAVIDRFGNFWVEPYAAYDYTDEEVQNLAALEASTNEEGDIFAAWSQGDVEVGGYWIVMGWLDHNWVGIEEEMTAPVEVGDFSLHPSVNPFSENVTIIVEGEPVPGQLAVYDISGRILRTLFRSGESSFLWDGCSSSGEELPAGSYMIQGASAGRLTSVTVVKL